MYRFSVSFLRLLLPACALAWIGLLGLHSWIHEDANISFRVIDNVLDGYGLRWNIDERVQVFTHPLWVILMIPFTGIMRLWFEHIDALNYAALALSLFCNAGMVVLMVKHFKKRTWILPIFFGMLFFSDAWKDYSVSGLENPLAYMLVSAWFYVFAKNTKQPPWKTLSLISALLLLVRLDYAVVLFPCWIWLLVRFHTSLYKNIRPLILGALPLLGWLIFCLIYYGAFLPNSFYAKRPDTLPLSTYLESGWSYFMDLFLFSPITFVMILFLPAYLLFFALRLIAHKNKERVLVMALGAIAYCLYVFWIGGDYMSGRLWTVPFLISVWIFGDILLHANWRIKRAFLCMLIAPAVAVLIEPSITSWNYRYSKTHEDERWLRIGTCLFCAQKADVPNTSWPLMGKKHREEAAALKIRESERKYVAAEGSVGLIGLYSGPDVVIVDWLGITEPILVRFPVEPPAPGTQMRVGHLGHRIPEGYLEARATGNVEKLPPEYRKIYTEMRAIVSDPIWRWKRWKHIFHFQSGWGE